MRRDIYPVGSVRDLLPTPLVTPATQAALVARLAPDESTAPRYFDASTFATLSAACARLLPQPDRSEPVGLLPAIDARLARNDSDGWRYASLPPDGESYRRGAAGLDETSHRQASADFVSLDAEAQERVLRSVQSGEAEGEVWKTLSAARFFEDFLAEITEIYYSHPLAQEEIGYVGMADARGWQQIGLNEREAWEPLALGGGHDRS